MKLRVVVPPHPLISHWLTMLRNSSTPPALYSTGLEELGKWLTYEALRDWLPHKREEVFTEISKTTGEVIENKISLLAIPIDPSGYEIWHGARKVLPNPHLCHGGIPTQIEDNSGIIIFTGQISNGKTLIKSLEKLSIKKIATKRIRVITVLSSSPGLQNIAKKWDDLNIYCACIDPELTKKDEISPGIGTPTERLNTRITPPELGLY